MFEGQPCAHDHQIDTAFGMGLDPQNGIERSVVTRTCVNAAFPQVAPPSTLTTYLERGLKLASVQLKQRVPPKKLAGGSVMS